MQPEPETEEQRQHGVLHQLTGARKREPNALGILLGRTPKALVEAALPEAAMDFAAIDLPALPALPPAGLPSTLLLTRPDI